MKRKADDSDAGGEGSERGSASSFVGFVCTKCNVTKSGSSFVWAHGGWCLQCVSEYYRQQRESQRMRDQSSSQKNTDDNSKDQK